MWSVKRTLFVRILLAGAGSLWAFALVASERWADCHWKLTLEADDAAPDLKPSFCARSSATPVELSGNGDVRHLVWRSVGDGTNTWPVEVSLECRKTANGCEVTGRLENKTKDLRICSFAGPRFGNLSVAGKPTLYVANGLGARVRRMPVLGAAYDRKTWIDRGNGVYECDAGWRGDVYRYPGPNRTMQYLALEGAEETLYFGCHDPHFDNKDLKALYDARTKDFIFVVEQACTIGAGGSWSLPPVVLERLKGDWHTAARYYRKWSDRVFKPMDFRRAGRDFAGWLLVILKQQNREIVWPYTDFDQLADVAVAHGLDWIGLFGWTAAGHDNRYPDYEPCPEMGGRDGLVEGLRVLHARGLKVFIYANGQLQERGATEYWKTTGRHHAIIRADGTPNCERWQKYASSPARVFDIACLYSSEWYERMLAQARQAAELGADGILYDQLASVQSRRCYGVGHGHPVGQAVQGGERVSFIRKIDAEMQGVKPGFHVLTEGFADCELDSISIFHGCEPGVFGAGGWLDGVDPRRGREGTMFPELVRYTFPEMVSSTRNGSPLSTRTMANYAALLGLRHDVEVRYSPDRRYVTTGKIPKVEEYGDILSKPELTDMCAGVSQRQGAAYLKSVCDFQRRQAKYLLCGRFVDTEGFSVEGPVQAKGYRAADGSLGVLVWNTDEKNPARFSLKGPCRPSGADEPGSSSRVAPFGSLPPNSLRLIVFGGVVETQI